VTGEPTAAPGLLVKTLAVTFLTVSVLLVIVFTFVTVRMHQQIKDAVVSNLESTQRLFAAIETRRQSEMRAQAAAVAESPTLKAAIDTFAAEASTSTPEERAQWLATITNEVDKVARAADADAIVLVDTHQTTLAASGRLADRWPSGRPITIAGAGHDATAVDGVAQAGGATFRLVSVPLVLGDGSTIGTLYLATSLDRKYAEDLKQLSRVETAVIDDSLLLATTLPDEAGKEFESAIARTHAVDGQVVLDGGSYAFRRLVQVGPAAVYALASIDDSSRAVLATLRRDLAIIAAGAMLLALVASLWLAHLVTKPIERLSTSLYAMTAEHAVDARLPLTGSSRELDALTDTFNTLMASVGAAEAQREAAYTGAIRALAAALDARDPYTAGHSERVSVLSVAVGRVLALSPEDLEVIRLGALLHDIGKIGVPDDVLRKAGPLTDREFDAIKQHPVLGARILKSVPFLARHIPIVELHHERPDGRGYPYGLRADDIPIAARIVHVADAYDAMTSARAYRRAMPSGDALRELWRCSGTEFDAEIVGALATALPHIVSTLVDDDGNPGELAEAAVG
jgi:putative nucleotidyltransferase with HDIG domain